MDMILDIHTHIYLNGAGTDMDTWTQTSVSNKNFSQL